jgi:class 3 adenylate cyclase/pimeloyl-ACP methyl ester carboxylesterase
VSDAPRIQYCQTSDGVDLAYFVIGSGPPLLWASTIFTSHLAKNWEVWNEMYQDVARYCTVIKYDERGSGLSDRDATDFSLQARLLDIEAVRQAAGIERVSVMGAGHGALAAAAYAAKYRDQVDRLVLLSPYSSGEELYRVSAPMKFIASLESVTEEQWDFVTMSMGTRMFGSDPVAARRLADMIRASMDPRGLIRFRDSNRSIDISPLLPRITATTLVVHHPDSEFPATLPRRFAAAIPNAQFMTFNWSGVAMLDPHERKAVIKFVSGSDPAPRREEPGAYRESTQQAVVRTVLFTDLVGHTEMMSRLGDQRGREVLREHETITRNVLKTHGGTEVKTIGDGFMASFGSVTKAVECAIALQRAFAERNSQLTTHNSQLNVRVGLNAGEPIEEDGDLFGATVILASRIAAKAESGEILVADTVRGLCSGKGFLFSDRGEFVAKGFEEPVRVYEVRWRSDES